MCARYVFIFYFPGFLLFPFLRFPVFFRAAMRPLLLCGFFYQGEVDSVFVCLKGILQLDFASVWFFYSILLLCYSKVGHYKHQFGNLRVFRFPTVAIGWYIE